MMVETGHWISETADAFKLDAIEQHNVATMARALAGRPNIKIMKTPMTFKKPILDCDTKAHKDAIKFMSFFEEDSPTPHGVIICECDGQSMITRAQTLSNAHVPASQSPSHHPRERRLVVVSLQDYEA